MIIVSYSLISRILPLLRVRGYAVVIADEAQALNIGRRGQDESGLTASKVSSTAHVASGCSAAR